MQELHLQWKLSLAIRTETVLSRCGVRKKTKGIITIYSLTMPATTLIHEAHSKQADSAWRIQTETAPLKEQSRESNLFFRLLS